MKNYWLMILFGALFVSCKVSPMDIHYEHDQCHACRMTISDPRFGAELVTRKGKVFKFDAIECMVPEVNRFGEEHYAFLMATDYHHPASLVSVQELNFLISNEIPSPMGRNLSAHRERQASLSGEGQWYTWTELMNAFSQ